MALIRVGVSISLVALGLTPLHAQQAPDSPESLTPAQIALACAPPASAATAPANALRILGTQDIHPRTLYSPRDLLVIGGGTGAGLRLGQQFFIRRAIRVADGYMSRGPSTTTAGWLRLVALNETTSLAMVEHVCGAIFQNDYLDPFELPSVPPGADRDDSTGELNFSSMARVVVGPENRRTAAPGDYVVIDRGTDHGVAAGGRLAIYRDVRVPGMPMAALGEAVVMSSGPTVAVIRINRARDAVMAGDYLVPRK
jgi:hypothetical protein